MTEAAGPPLLRVCGVTKRFPGVVANDRIDLEVRRGEIHAVLGENGAGKSTLMQVIGGLLAPDEGMLQWEGREVCVDSPRAAFALGIGLVHQHFMLVPRLSVLENVTLGMPRVSGGRRAAVRRLREIAAEFELGVDPLQRVETLSVGARQKVEIIKALFRDARLLVLDEPTASLAPAEAGRLFALARRVAARGGAVIFITHRLEEVLAFCDRATVLREGRQVGTVAVRDVTAGALASLMIGAEPTRLPPRSAVAAGPVRLEVDRLSTAGEFDAVALSAITFGLAAGEIIGIAGVDGNGQSELVEALIGLRRPLQGRVAVCGVDTAGATTADILGLGVSVVPGDRHREAIVEEASLSWNALLGPGPGEPWVRRGSIRWPEVRRKAREIVAALKVKTPGVEAPMRTLSGGHQQRFVLGRALQRAPKVLVVVQPTRGLDLESATLIRSRLLALREGGTAILLIAMDLDEIFALSDRIAVLFGGRIVGWGTPASSRSSLGLLMAGVVGGPPAHA